MSISYINAAFIIFNVNNMNVGSNIININIKKICY